MSANDRPAPRRFVMEARRWLDTPFEFRGRERGVGADCLGLVIGSYEASIAHFGAKVPDYPPACHRFSHRGLNCDFLEEVMGRVFDDEMREGDVIVFSLHSNVLWHLGIVIDDDHFLHSHRKRGVEIAELNNFWRDKIHRIYRLKEQ